MNKPPLVSICSLTYNHAPYIRQCLDGMLMQQTNFPFEVIINDDCSTDGTTEIIRDYAERFPEIIKPIFHEENQYQKGLRGFFQKFVFPKAQGKYIALCEGDDYWTDPLKLQKQVDFLETHPDYSLCFHNAMVHYEDGKSADHIFAELKTKEYNRKELTEKWLAPTASFLLRKDILFSEWYKKITESKKLLYADFPLLICSSYCGKIWCIADVMSIYRKHEGGVMNTYNSIQNKICVHCIELKKIFPRDFYPLINRSIGKFAIISLSKIKRGHIISGFSLLYKAFINAPKETYSIIKLYLGRKLCQ